MSEVVRMDYIDKRNMQEKMAKSIIKRRNVIYTIPQEPVQATSPENEEMTSMEANALTSAESVMTEEEELALEILKRLEKEHQEDEMRKRREIELLLEEQERNQQEINRIMNKQNELLEKTVNEAAKGE